MPITFTFPLAPAAPPVFASAATPTSSSPSTIPKLADLSDLSTFDDTTGQWGLTFREIRGARVVLEWVARSWLISGLVWNQNIGEDIRLLENADLPLADLERKRRSLEAEARAVPFVVVCNVKIEFDDGSGDVTIGGDLMLADGKRYPLIVNVDQAAAAIAAEFQGGVPS